MDFTTDQKGSIAEAAIAYAATRLGVGVSKPLSDGERYDLIFDLHPRLLRVQCKWANRCGDVLTIRCYSARRSRNGLLKRTYNAQEIDAFAAYCPSEEKCYLVPLPPQGPAPTEIQLRLAPTRNNQVLGIRWAKDFELEATLERLVGP